MRIYNRGFTIVELMIVVVVIGILIVALSTNLGTYMSRSRDTKRITDMLGYTSILDAYDKNFDTFPSNKGSGGLYNLLGVGYCLSELAMRNDIVGGYPDAKFSALRNGSAVPPTDPTNQVTFLPLCPTKGSYIYSRIDYGTNQPAQLALIAAKLEQPTSANYATGSDLTSSGMIQQIMTAKKGSITSINHDQLYVVYKMH